MRLKVEVGATVATMVDVTDDVDLVRWALGDGRLAPGVVPATCSGRLTLRGRGQPSWLVEGHRVRLSLEFPGETGFGAVFLGWIERTERDFPRQGYEVLCGDELVHLADKKVWTTYELYRFPELSLVRHSDPEERRWYPQGTLLGLPKSVCDAYGLTGTDKYYGQHNGSFANDEFGGAWVAAGTFERRAINGVTLGAMLGNVFEQTGCWVWKDGLGNTIYRNGAMDAALLSETPSDGIFDLPAKNLDGSEGGNGVYDSMMYFMDPDAPYRPPINRVPQFSNYIPPYVFRARDFTNAPTGMEVVKIGGLGKVLARRLVQGSRRGVNFMARANVPEVGSGNGEKLFVETETWMETWTGATPRLGLYRLASDGGRGTQFGRASVLPESTSGVSGHLWEVSVMADTSAGTYYIFPTIAASNPTDRFESSYHILPQETLWVEWYGVDGLTLSEQRHLRVIDYYHWGPRPDVETPTIEALARNLVTVPGQSAYRAVRNWYEPERRYFRFVWPVERLLKEQRTYPGEYWRKSPTAVWDDGDELSAPFLTRAISLDVGRVSGGWSGRYEIYAIEAVEHKWQPTTG